MAPMPGACEIALPFMESAAEDATIVLTYFRLYFLLVCACICFPLYSAFSLLLLHSLN